MPFRVACDVDGSARAFLSFDLTKSDSVILSLILNEPYVETDSPGRSFPLRTNNGRIREKKYSFHASIKSEDGRSQVHHTIKTDTDFRKDSYLYTSAINDKNKYVPVTFSRFSSINTNEHKIKNNKKKTISLGRLEQEKFTLYLSIFATNIGTDTSDFVEWFSENDCGVLTLIPVGRVMFVVISGFSMMPTGSSLHIQPFTVSDKMSLVYDRVMNDALMKGINWIDASDMHLKFRDMIFSDQMDSISRDFGIDRNFIPSVISPHGHSTPLSEKYFKSHPEVWKITGVISGRS